MAFSGVEEAAGVLSYLNLNAFFDDFADYLGNCFVANGATCVGGAAIMTEGKLYNIYSCKLFWSKRENKKLKLLIYSRVVSCFWSSP